jgi:hypothetical protein
MSQIPHDLERRLHFILHLGLTQARSLALAAGNEQIADLTDALELLPALMDRWDEENLRTVRFVLETYQKKYPGGSYDFLAYLEKCAPPERY